MSFLSNFGIHFEILETNIPYSYMAKSTKKALDVLDFGKIPPQAKELEEAVLGALMLEKDAYYIVSDILKPECFYEKVHQLIYSAIVDLA